MNITKENKKEVENKKHCVLGLFKFNQKETKGAKMSYDVLGYEFHDVNDTDGYFLDYLIADAKQIQFVRSTCSMVRFAESKEEALAHLRFAEKAIERNQYHIDSVQAELDELDPSDVDDNLLERSEMDLGFLELAKTEMDKFYSGAVASVEAKYGKGTVI